MPASCQYRTSTSTVDYHDKTSNFPCARLGRLVRAFSIEGRSGRRALPAQRICCQEADCASGTTFGGETDVGVPSRVAEVGQTRSEPNRLSILCTATAFASLAHSHPCRRLVRQRIWCEPRLSHVFLALASVSHRVRPGACSVFRVTEQAIANCGAPTASATSAPSPPAPQAHPAERGRASSQVRQVVWRRDVPIET